MVGRKPRRARGGMAIQVTRAGFEPCVPCCCPTNGSKPARLNSNQKLEPGRRVFRPTPSSVPCWQLPGCHQEIQYLRAADDRQYRSLSDFAAHQETVQVIDRTDWSSFEGDNYIAFPKTG